MASPPSHYHSPISPASASSTSSIPPPPPELDHIVHLVPTGKLEEAIHQFEALGFAVEHGGIHADGLTHNALIILTDGVYIEIIAFLEGPTKGSVEPKEEWRKRREAHWWWGRQLGWIDWCLKGGVKDGRVAAINKVSADTQPDQAHEKETMTSKSLGKLVRYSDPKEGGREALSGRHIRWKVAFPKGRKEERGAVPFWCEDDTPRWWRVPTPSPHHPNDTQGLTALTLLYYPDYFAARISSLRLVTNNLPGGISNAQQSIHTDPAPLVEGDRPMLPPEPVELVLGTPEGPPLPVKVKAAEDPEELSWLAKYGEGLFEVEISVAPEKLPPSAPPDGIERDTHRKGYGRLRLHPILRH